MATNKDTQDDNEELVIVETRRGVLTDNDDDKDKRKPINGAPADAADDEDEEGDEEEERVVKRGDDGAGGDETVEQRRERRRKEKVERRERREEAMRRNKLEMDFLRRRNEDLERRFSAVEVNVQQRAMSDVDNSLTQAQRDLRAAEEVIKRAMAAGNHDDVVQAMRYRDDAMRKIERVSAFKEQAERRIQEPPQASAPPPQVMSHAQKFISENKDWYDPNGANEDSAIVLAIDNRLAQEGYDPSSKEYWDELRSRVQKRLPERFEAPSRSASADDNTRTERKPRGGPNVGGGRDNSGSTGRREVYISPERKQALIDLGVWDNPDLRAKYVKRYSEYDRDAKSRG